MIEVWKNISGFPGYQVSSLGRVKSCVRMNRRREMIRKTPLRAGYPFLVLCKKGERFQIHVHVLVAKAFLDKSATRKHVNHIDGNRTNNTVENLEWVTHRENRIHACRILGKGRGSENGNSSLKEHQVKEIKAKLKLGRSLREIAKEYDVVKGTILFIKQGRTWAHITI